MALEAAFSQHQYGPFTKYYVPFQIMILRAPMRQICSFPYFIQSILSRDAGQAKASVCNLKKWDTPISSQTEKQGRKQDIGKEMYVTQQI